MSFNKIFVTNTILLIIAAICSAFIQLKPENSLYIAGEADSLRTFKTSTGKSIIIRETHPIGLSVSRIEIISHGFKENNAIILDSIDPMINAELTDLDNDGYNELFLFTKSAGSGSSGTIYGYESENDQKLRKIGIMQAGEKDFLEGGEFEGYMGHDRFWFENNFLVREFPVYRNTDSNVIPTGGTKKVYYRYINYELRVHKVIRTE